MYRLVIVIVSLLVLNFETVSSYSAWTSTILIAVYSTIDWLLFIHLYPIDITSSSSYREVFVY